MAVLFSAASIDENGRIAGGRAGDQTGREVRTTNAYIHNLGWRVFRHPNKNTAYWIGTNARTMADNNNFGYDQNQRDSGYIASKEAGWEPARVNYPVEIDCSSGVRTAVACALERDIPNFNTATEAQVLLNLGFTEIKNWSLNTLELGDILVTKTKGHTEICSQGGTDSGYSPSPAPTPSRPDIVYRVKTLQNGWLPEVVNDSDYAGIENRAVVGFMVKMSNGSPIRYRCHLTNGTWLGWVSGYSASDYSNGYAGDDKTAIDAIEIKCDAYDVRYKVSTLSTTSYLGEVLDATTSGGDAYAGMFGRAIDKVMCRVV